MAISGRFPPLLVQGRIPAFYVDPEDGETGILSVPFTISGGATISDLVGGNIVLRLKTLQEVILTNSIRSEYLQDNNLAIFRIPKEIIDQLYIGQYLKVQIAAIAHQTGQVGYYSDVAITKFTSKPSISIYGYESNIINNFSTSIIGIYSQASEDSDITERVNKYIFNLYNNNGQLIQSSGWKTHNSAIDDTTGTMALFSASTDSYDFLSNLRANTIYYVEYGVRTINGLEEYSERYSAQLSEIGTVDYSARLVAENIFDDGYMLVYFDNISGFSSSHTEDTTYFLSRADDRDFATWYLLSVFTMKNITELENWEYKDFLIEQGRTYKYSIQCLKNQNYSQRQETESFITADFEDMFLYDGQRQLKIKYNPKVSSFKLNHSETKIETIGNQFPYVFRNGNIEYYEFQLSGLISYLMDENEEFIKQADIGLIHNDNQSRLRTNDQAFIEKDIPTTQLTGYNMFSERLFKKEVLQWLSNGKEKIFKSPAEGNYIVRLINISMSPNDTLGRMLHTFSATAYETAKYDYQTIKQKQFLHLA